MESHFEYDKRLGIYLPSLQEEWSRLPADKQQSLLLHWETIRGGIPDRIAELERNINEKQARLSDESNFQRSCELNNEIAALASAINDLWLWYRNE